MFFCFFKLNHKDNSLGKCSQFCPKLLTFSMNLPETEIKPENSNDFDMGSWKSDDYLRELHNDIYFWVIPANVKGQWRLTFGKNNFTMQANQEFQEVFPNIKNDNSALALKDMVLRGDRISFAASDFEGGIDYVFSGHISGDAITGVVQVRNENDAKIQNWSAIRFMTDVE